ncbi:MAG: 50S ribosomal protein L7Ae [Ferroplasma sp.]
MENTYVKFEAPESLVKESLDFVENSYRSGKIKKGTNEVVKSIERGEAKVVVIAEDVSPPEVVFYLPILCEERKVPYTFVKNKSELGLKVGIASAASIAVVDFGKNDEAYKTLLSSITSAKTGKSEKKEVKSEKKETEKPEEAAAPVEEKIEEPKEKKEPKKAKETAPKAEKEEPKEKKEPKKAKKAKKETEEE